MKNVSTLICLLLLCLNVMLIKSQEISGIKRRIQVQVRKLNAKENLREYLNNGGIFDCDNTYCTQISLINSQYNDNQIQVFPQIFIENIGSNKVVVKIFKKHKFSENSKNYIAGLTAIADIVYFNLYDFENDLISQEPISLINLGIKDLLVYLPIYLTDTLKNKYLSVSGQNPSSDIKDLLEYDIFYPDAKIYTDLCTPITFSFLTENKYSRESFKNLDITLKQRKNYYFPGNLELCPKSCAYNGIDRTTMSSICKCSLDYLEIVEHNDYISFNFNEKDFQKTNKDIYFSMDTMKCINISFTSSGIKNNYGFFIVLILAIVILLSFGLLFCFGNDYINQKLTLKKNNVNEKNIANPPKDEKNEVEEEDHKDVKFSEIPLNMNPAPNQGIIRGNENKNINQINSPQSDQNEQENQVIIHNDRKNNVINNNNPETTEELDPRKKKKQKMI